jgi:hypothetical protein
MALYNPWMGYQELHVTDASLWDKYRYSTGSLWLKGAVALSFKRYEYGNTDVKKMPF